MPYEEFASWQTFYLIEPWGWYDREYRTGALLAKIHNSNVTKRADAKDVKDFVRDMPKLVANEIQRMRLEEKVQEKYRNASRQERARMIAASFGTTIKDK
jgi:hypothetical protein